MANSADPDQLAIGLIMSTFDRIICPPQDSGRVFLFHVCYLWNLYVFSFLQTKPLLKNGSLKKKSICFQGEEILSY